MKIMDFKKIFTTKTGLAAVIVIITILSILGYSIVCKRGGSYMFKDSRGEVKENFQNGEKVYDLSEKGNDRTVLTNGALIFDGIDIDGEYENSGNQYHIVVDTETGNVTVDEKTIFTSPNGLFKIYLYDNILFIQVKKSSAIDLFFVDMNGTLIKEIDNVKQVSNYNLDIYYSFDSVGTDDVNMYEPSSLNLNKITYLGNMNFSEVETKEYYQPSCDGSDYCVISDMPGLEVVYYRDKFKHSLINSDYSLLVNGKSVEIGYHLSGIVRLPDGCLLISSSFQDGLSFYINIVDRNGNVVVDFMDYMRNDEFTSRHLLAGDSIYDNGKIIIYSAIPDNFEKYYYNGDYAITDDELKTIIGRKRVFNYLGNGKVDDAPVISNITLGEWLQNLKLIYDEH